MPDRSRLLVLALPIVLVAGGCSGGPGGWSAPSPGTPSSSSAPSTPTASTPTATEATAAAAGQTETDWGRIWDAVPAGFPLFPGATPADDATGEPASARSAVAGGDPLAIAEWMQDALETATFSTEALNGPGEDGGYVIDSTGEGGCRIQTSIVPLGDTTFVSVLYGADCPGP